MKRVKPAMAIAPSPALMTMEMSAPPKFFQARPKPVMQVVALRTSLNASIAMAAVLQAAIISTILIVPQPAEIVWLKRENIVKAGVAQPGATTPTSALRIP